MLHREPCGKALVFSQFTSLLALIQHRLEQVHGACQLGAWAHGMYGPAKAELSKAMIAMAIDSSYMSTRGFPSLKPHLTRQATNLPQVGIRVVRLDGSMSLDARDRVINQFTNDPEVRRIFSRLCLVHGHAASTKLPLMGSISPPR